MKKRIVLMLLALMLTAAGCVSAESERAREVQALFFPDGVPENVADTLYLMDAEGNEWYLVGYKNGIMHGYLHVEEKGKWGPTWKGLIWFTADDLRIVQTGDTSFDVESPSLDARMRYVSAGLGFRLVGWRDGNAWPGDVELTDGAAMFQPDDQSADVEVPIGEDLRGWLHSFDGLPKTPEDMRARAALCRENVALMMPGWTMGDYEMYNDGNMAFAAFWRIENGELTISGMILESGGGTRTWKTLAIPLSESLLKRLETEAFDTLIDVSGEGSTFLTQDAWDPGAIPISGKIIQNDLQTNALTALTERDGNRYVAVAEQDARGTWSVRESKPLPPEPEASMDLYHFGDDEICLEWYDGSETGMTFARRADGSWRLDGVWIEAGSEHANYWPSWYGLRMEREDWEDGETYDVYAYGTFAFTDLFTLDFDQLPQTTREAAALVDPSGWAAVRNPEPSDRLHLREAPDQTAGSLGKFYTGTPLQILDGRGDWTKVRVGAEQAMEGWMKTEYLVFGDDLKDVSRAFPELFLQEEREGLHPLLPDGQTEAAYTMDGRETVIGVREQTEQWIVMTEEGGVFLVPMDWFWAGNG